MHNVIAQNSICSLERTIDLQFSYRFFLANLHSELFNFLYEKRTMVQYRVQAERDISTHAKWCPCKDFDLA